jgi:peptidyl-dipeptidase Dcp
MYNFAKPTSGNPSLISFDDVTTLFHEFGILTWIVCKSAVCNAFWHVPRDYVEFPSQINEHAALDPAVLKIMRYIIKPNRPFHKN